MNLGASETGVQVASSQRTESNARAETHWVVSHAGSDAAPSGHGRTRSGLQDSHRYHSKTRAERVRIETNQRCAHVRGGSSQRGWEGAPSRELQELLHLEHRARGGRRGLRPPWRPADRCQVTPAASRTRRQHSRSGRHRLPSSSAAASAQWWPPWLLSGASILTHFVIANFHALVLISIASPE